MGPPCWTGIGFVFSPNNLALLFPFEFGLGLAAVLTI